MTNYNKSFNFRNGVQVDDTNFIINANGLVGIGTSIPREVLDVHGNAKITGFITATTIYSSRLEVETTTNTLLNVGVVSITSAGIITASSSGGIVTYYGDGGNLLNLPTSQWVDVDPGFGYTSIYAAGNVGIATTYPNYTFQVGGNVGAGQSGVGINSLGSIIATGIITASNFVGIGSDLTILNASNIGIGTLNTSRLPSNINVSGIITGYSFAGFGTNLTGINASNISNGTLNNSRLPSNINVSGIITATEFAGVNFVGTAFTGSTFVGTAFTGSTFTGDLIGTATTASSLSGTPNIEVGTVTASNVTASNLSATGIVTASEFNLGIGGTIVNITSDGRVGIGSTLPTRSFEIITTETAAIELVGSESIIILAEEKSGVGIADSAGVIRYGNSDDTFELLNYTPGNFNFYLHAGGPGINTGRFGWVYGQDFNEVLSLTYDGLLGVGVTDPEHNLHVVGTSTVTGNSFIGGDLTVSGDLNVTGTTNVTVTLPSVFDGNVNSTSGVSTFSNVIVSAGSSLGIGTDTPITDIDAFNRILVVGAIGVGQSFVNIENRLPDIGSIYTDGQIICDGVGIGTTSLGSQSRTLMVYGNVELYPGIEEQGGPPAQISYVKGTKVEVAFDNESRIGIGTTVSQASVDFRLAGKGISGGAASFMMPPQVSTTVGLNTAGKEGALVFNTTTKKFQGYTGSAWVDLH